VSHCSVRSTSRDTAKTDGEEGHDWQGTKVLLLATTGRKSGKQRTTPLIYQRHGDTYLVVASNGGGDTPGWFLNLQEDPTVGLQVKAEHHTARARIATAEGEARAVAHHDRDRGTLRRLPGQGQPRAPRRDTRADLGC
jgi:deazaflavin-dependent oxidoreductase (nitroreductase family)